MADTPELARLRELVEDLVSALWDPETPDWPRALYNAHAMGQAADEAAASAGERYVGT